MSPEEQRSFEIKYGMETPFRRVFMPAAQSFFTSVVNQSKKNPRMPYLGGKLDKPTMAEAVNAMDDLMTLISSGGASAEAARECRSIVQSATSTRKQRADRRWCGRNVYTGSITQRQQGAMLWDKKDHCMVYALQVGGFGDLDIGRYMYVDGEDLVSDGQLTKSHSWAMLPIKARHEFRRWWLKHVDNHDAQAPAHRRAWQTTVQIVIDDDRVFMRPVLDFGQEGGGLKVDVATCRYFIGIDIGVNYPLRAVTYDSQTKTIIHDLALYGDKWSKLKRYAEIDTIKGNLDSGSTNRRQRRQQMAQLEKAYSRLKASGKPEVERAVAELVQKAEADYGRGNYCFVLEALNPADLVSGARGVRRLKKVSSCAKVQEALHRQLVKMGYRNWKGKDGKPRVDGLTFVSAYGTSQVAPSGKRFTKASTAHGDGRTVGQSVSKSPLPNGSFPVGSLEKVPGRRWKTLVVGGETHASFGSELMMDDGGLIYEADFVGAMNLAVRPSVLAQSPDLKKEDLVEAQAALVRSIRLKDGVTRTYSFAIEQEGTNTRRVMRANHR